MAYHPTSCDLYFAAAGHEIYRLNLEQVTVFIRNNISKLFHAISK